MSDPFKGWAVLELMGHKKVAGMVEETVLAGSPILRIDIPCDPPMTQFYGGSSLYCMTPCSEEICRNYAAAASRPEPISVWEMRKPVKQEQLSFVGDRDNDVPFDADEEEFDG